MKICVLPGDGIGPEIVAQAVRVLNSLDLKFELEEALLGGAAVDATGSPYPVSYTHLDVYKRQVIPWKALARTSKKVAKPLKRQRPSKDYHG